MERRGHAGFGRGHALQPPEVTPLDAEYPEPLKSIHNPPLALYYMQGLNTTPLHGHTALFGVYGMLGIGLMLFCLRGLGNLQQWDERLLKGAFWSLNLGLAAMALLSLFPYGLMQVATSVVATSNAALRRRRRRSSPSRRRLASSRPPRPVAIAAVAGTRTQTSGVRRHRSS